VLEERRIESRVLKGPRTVWVLRGDPDDGVYVLLDGEYYVDVM